MVYLLLLVDRAMQGKAAECCLFSVWKKLLIRTWLVHVGTPFLAVQWERLREVIKDQKVGSPGREPSSDLEPQMRLTDVD